MVVPARLWLVVLIAACKYHSPGDDDGTITIVEDTAADFAGAQLIDGQIDPEGTLTPAPYAMFGLHARAYADKHVDATTTFATLDQDLATQTPLGESYAQLPADWGNLHPRELGIGATKNEDWSVVFDGDIYLTAGTVAIALDADDAGIVEVTVDGTAFFVADSSGGVQTIDVPVTTDGWYPIRAAIGESTGNAKLDIKINGAVLGNRITRSRIGATGMLAQLFANSHSGILGRTVVAGADHDLGMVAPPVAFDIPTTSTRTYTLRETGQIHIDVAGTWTFEPSIASQDMTRLYIDGVHIASKFGTNSAGLTDGVASTGTVDLTVGWHGIAIDELVNMTDAVGNPVAHAASIGVIATPPGGAPGPLAATQFRPVLSSAIPAGFAEDTNQPITLDGQTKIPFTILAGPTTMRSLDVGTFLFHTDPAAYTLTLEAGTTVIPMAIAGSVGQTWDDHALAGQPIPTDWVLHFVDNTVGSPFVDPHTTLYFLDLTGDGGPAMPFAQVMTYVSKPLATPGALDLGAIRLVADPGGATIALAVRTADTAEALEAATFVDVADGAVPATEASEFIQYRVTATGDGWQFPVIDAIELDYVVSP